ncbi:3872_t:CDS:1, partial [Cetraspora pellucida]
MWLLSASEAIKINTNQEKTSGYLILQFRLNQNNILGFCERRESRHISSWGTHVLQPR